MSSPIGQLSQGYCRPVSTFICPSFIEQDDWESLFHDAAGGFLRVEYVPVKKDMQLRFFYPLAMKQGNG